MTTEELRRLAEQERERATPGHLNVSAVAILSLLDERDARESAANYYRDLAAERAHLQGLAEQRVVALEEGLRRLTDEYWDRHGQEVRGQRIGDDRDYLHEAFVAADLLLQASAQAQATPSGNASEGSANASRGSGK